MPYSPHRFLVTALYSIAVIAPLLAFGSLRVAHADMQSGIERDTASDSGSLERFCRGTWHLCPSGSDSQGNGRAESPFQTLERGLEACAPNEIVASTARSRSISPAMEALAVRVQLDRKRQAWKQMVDTIPLVRTKDRSICLVKAKVG